MYTANNGDQQNVSALLDGDMKMQSMILEKNLSNGKMVKTTFYFFKESLIVSKRLIKNYSEKGVFISEEKSYYTPEGNVAFTGIRKSKDEKTLPDLHFTATENKAHDPSSAFLIINQSGDYQTLFQGFEEAMGKSFLVVGTDKQTSTLAHLEPKGDLKKLLDNSQKYLGKRLKIGFTNIDQPDGFSYQGLTELTILD
jgi:hypothetical protein